MRRFVWVEGAECLKRGAKSLIEERNSEERLEFLKV